MSSNFSAILEGDGSGLLVFKTFLLPILYVTIALVTVTGDAIAKRYCSKPIRKSAGRRKTQNRVYSVEQTREEVLNEALKRGAQLEFFSSKRTFENFGNLTKRNIISAASRGQRTAYDSGRRVLYTTFQGTSFQIALRPAVVMTCFAGLWCWMILLFEELSVDNPEWLQNFLEHCSKLATLNTSLKTYVSFMFVFYAINSLQLWAKVFWICNEIDDRAVNIAMNASSVLHSKSDRDKRVRWKVYRYIAIAHFLVYGTVSKSVRAKSSFFTSQLLAVGLLTEAEKVSLDASPSPKITVVMWLSQLFNHPEVADIPLNTRLIVISKIISMKDYMADLEICMQSYPPLSWAQVMQVLVDVYLLFTPVAFVSKMYIDGTEVQIWPLVSTFLVTIFFQGLLGMINLIRNPFGSDVDDFNFDHTLLRCERECLSYLGYPAVDAKKLAAEARAKKLRLEQKKAEAVEELAAKGGDPSTKLPPVAEDSDSDSEDEVFDPYKHSKSITVDQFEALAAGRKSPLSPSSRLSSGSIAKKFSGVGAAVGTWRSQDAWQDRRGTSSMGSEADVVDSLLKTIGRK